MHLIFYIRGIYNQVEMFKTLAQGQFWKWKRINLETGKEEITLVQGSLRPSLLGAYEYIFPEECLAEVLSVFGLTKDSFGTKPFFIGKVKIAALRKAFGAKKIPKVAFEAAKDIPSSVMITNSQRGLSQLFVTGVAIHPLGIKYDEFKEKDWDTQAGSDTGKYYQEML